MCVDQNYFFQKRPFLAKKTNYFSQTFATYLYIVWCVFLFTILFLPVAVIFGFNR